MKFRDIPQFTWAGYSITQPWDGLEDALARYVKIGLDLDPDFQRAHVWTEDKQRAYVEFQLRGGRGARDIQFNCVGWMRDFRGPFVLVDGKQRIEAVRRFLRNDLTVFDGHRLSDFEDEMPSMVGPSFTFHVHNLPTRAAVLNWYLALNSGGVVHTDDELRRVRALLEREA